ncbi:MAG: hypothetical protein ABSF80_02585 [Chitinispirillaceae bacterium]|jgi:hypothetical protein
MADACIRRLDVELYSAGDLSAAAAAGLAEHLHSCPSCSAYLAKLKKEREEFLRAHPFAEFLSAGVADNRGERWYEKLITALSFPVIRPVLAPVAILLVAAVVVPFIIKPAGNDIRYKGAPGKSALALSYIYKRDGAVHTSTPQDLFRVGDQVQVFYSSDKEQNVSLFSVDSKGVVSFYQPDAQSALCSIRSGAGPQVAYPKSIVLDSTQGAELVVAVFSEEPFDTNQIKKWVAGFKITADMVTLEKTVKSNPPAKKNIVQTLLLKKG